MVSLSRHGFGCLVRVLRVALILLLPATSGQAEQHLIANVHLMVEGAAVLDVHDAARGRFIPVVPTMTFGYSSAAHWLRLRILPAPDGEQAVLLIRPPMLDHVRVYEPVLFGPSETDAPSAIGQYRALEPSWPSSMRGYIISPPEGGADYFVQIVSTGSISINVTALPRVAAIRVSLFTDLVQICYFAIMLILAMWALRMLSVTREKLFGWFAAMQLVWLFHNLLSFGYLGALFPGLEKDTLTLAFRTAVFVAAFLSVSFHRSVMIRFQPAAFALRMFDFQRFMMLLAFILFWTFDRGIALHINAYCIVAAPFIFLLNIYTARKEASPGLFTLRLIYTVLSVSLLLWVFSLLGFGRAWVISLYGFMLHGMTTGLLMYVILHRHGRNLVAAARDAEAEIAAKEQQRMMQQEKTRTLAQFIDMLGHEARNALSVINMSIASPTISDRQRARVDDAIRGLSGVIDRCNQTIRLDTNGQTITQENCNLVEMLQTLCAEADEAARITFQAQGPDSVQGDPVLLGVVFSNLIDNALKYSPGGSVVSVSLESGTDGVSVLFENVQGAAGMPDPAHVFEKYYRSHRAKGKIGSGLGLYIVRGLVQLLGGTVTYEPTDNHVRFRVWIPC